jgi:hypothetical protein
MDGHAHACARRVGARHHRPPLAHRGGASRRPLAGCAGSAGRAVVVLARRTRHGARCTARRGARAGPAARAGRKTQRGAVPPSRTLRTCTDGFAWTAWCVSLTPRGRPHSPCTFPRSRSSWSLRAHAVRERANARITPLRRFPPRSHRLPQRRRRARPPRRPSLPSCMSVGPGARTPQLTGAVVAQSARSTAVGRAHVGAGIAARGSGCADSNVCRRTAGGAVATRQHAAAGATYHVSACAGTRHARSAAVAAAAAPAPPRRCAPMPRASPRRQRHGQRGAAGRRRAVCGKGARDKPSPQRVADK